MSENRSFTPVEITREELALILADMKTMWASLRDIAMTAPGAAATISTRMELPQVIDMVFEQAGLASSERGDSAPDSENEALRHDIAKAIANHTADLQSLPSFQGEWKGPYVQPNSSGDIEATPSTGTTYKIPGPWAPALDTEEKIEAHLRGISSDKQETPRTDAVFHSHQQAAPGIAIGALLTLARQLERELAWQTNEAKRWRQACQDSDEHLSARDDILEEAASVCAVHAAKCVDLGYGEKARTAGTLCDMIRALKKTPYVGCPSKEAK